MEVCFCHTEHSGSQRKKQDGAVPKTLGPWLPFLQVRIVYIDTRLLKNKRKLTLIHTLLHYF